MNRFRWREGQGFARCVCWGEQRTRNVEVRRRVGDYSSTGTVLGEQHAANDSVEREAETHAPNREPTPRNPTTY